MRVGPSSGFAGDRHIAVDDDELLSATAVASVVRLVVVQAWEQGYKYRYEAMRQEVERRNEKGRCYAMMMTMTMIRARANVRVRSRLPEHLYLNENYCNKTRKNGGVSLNSNNNDTARVMRMCVVH